MKTVAAITQEARRLTLQLPAIDASFSGTLNEAGTELAGTPTQGTVARQIIFRRAASSSRK